MSVVMREARIRRVFRKKMTFEKVRVQKNWKSAGTTTTLISDFFFQIFVHPKSCEDFIFFFQTQFFWIPLVKWEVQCEGLRSKFLAVFEIWIFLWKVVVVLAGPSNYSESSSFFNFHFFTTTPRIHASRITVHL